MSDLAADRILACLREAGGTRRQLARRAGISADYAGDLLLGLQAAGKARRWKLPGTRAFMWGASDEQRR